LFFIVLAGCRQEATPPSPTASPEFTATMTNTRTSSPSSTAAPTIRPTPTQTATPTSTPSPTRSFQLATPAPSTTYPPNIERLSIYSGMEAWEIVAVYTVIHNALVADDPKPLAELIHYPIIGCGRCGGLTLETPEDFIKAYPSLIVEKTRLALAREKLEELGGNYMGVMFGGGEIWVSALCPDASCQTHTIYIIKFIDYCQYWFDREDMNNLAVDASNFAFGTYIVEPFDMEPDAMVTKEDISAIKTAKIEILPSSYKVNPPAMWFGKSCPAAVMEFCPESDYKYRDWSAVGMLNIVCGKDVVMRFDLLSTNRIAISFMLENIYLKKEG
jgi:hypothetical protein